MKQNTTRILSSKEVIEKAVKNALAKRNEQIREHFQAVKECLSSPQITYETYLDCCDELDIEPLERDLYNAHIGKFTTARKERIYFVGCTREDNEISIYRTVPVRYFK